ncbi:MAG TPA: carboxypeptidase regulatory-like domain-containing protein [bacterium]|nr:carboxypeptidase regulatory-like domain-containing protein [bacterium]
MKLRRLIWQLFLTVAVSLLAYLSAACDSEMLDKFDGRICVGAVWGQVTDTQDDPLGGVDVTLRDGIGTAMRTDDNGYFVIIGASVGEEMDVRFDKDGYARTHKPVNLMEGVLSSMETKMKKIQRLGQRSSDEDLDERLDDGSRVSVPPGALVDPDGNVATGAMDIAITGLRVETVDIGAAPGNFDGRDESGDEGKIESFGMIDMNFSQNGEALQLAPGETAMVEFEVGTLGREEGDVIPLWYYDSDAQQWIREGECEVMETDEDGTLACVGEVAHFSTWNADQTYEATCVKGMLRDQAGQPVAGALINSQGVSYNGEDRVNSNPDGAFMAYVKTSSRVVLNFFKEGGRATMEIESSDKLCLQATCCEDLGEVVLSGSDDDDDTGGDDAGDDDERDDDDDEIRAPGSDEPLTLCVDAYDEIEKACGEDM